MFTRKSAVVICFILATGLSAWAQSVHMGKTELALGMQADEALKQLSNEFTPTPLTTELADPRVNSWTIFSKEKSSDSSYYVSGFVSATDGKISSIGKTLWPNPSTASSVGEAFFLMLEQLAANSGEGCRIETSRKRVEFQLVAGGTMLSANIECPQYRGSLILYQGSSIEGLRDPIIQFFLHRPTGK